MQFYKHNTSRDGTHKQAGGRSVDAALLLKNSSRSTVLLRLMRWRKQEILYWLSVRPLYNNQGLIFIPGTKIWILLKYDSLQFLE